MGRDGGAAAGAGRVLKQIYTAQEYAVRAVQTIDRRRRSARRKAILAGEPQRGSP